MAKTIIDLPSELIASIVTYLDAQDVFAVRLSARPLERASFAHFGKRHFRKKGYMLTSPSLAVLEGVANHNELRKYVQHVWFNPDCFTFIRPDCAPDPEETPDPDNPDGLIDLLSPGDRKMYKAYEECMKDHVSLIANTASQLQKVLAVAFAKFPNLKIIGMRRSEDHSPWGWRTLKDAVGQDPRVLGPIPSGPMYTLSTPSRLFVALVNATSSSGITLRRFYTDAIELDNIRPDLLPQDALNKACNPIWYLEVNVMRGWLNTRHNADYITPGHPKWEPGIGLLRLLQSCTSLKEIGLQVFPDRQTVYRPNVDIRERFLESWPYQCFRNTIHNLSVRSLDRIKLEKIIASPTDLLAFLRPSAQALTSLKLRDIRLISDDGTPHPNRPWQPIFQFLHSSAYNLDFILFHHLLYAHGGVSFVPDIQPTPLPDEEGGEGEADSSDQHFTDYENITLQADSGDFEGKDGVRKRIGEAIERHWYQKPVFTYAMDETVWHTDTSDEDW
ncbi:hypothetical protein KC318_g10282 [Hortaea werneckii]|nr:hypothetical protein KC334_g10350 [Hortaea werneckii]KAI6994216.1 hypothetical protein KC355_g10279 [Hortaea werneckii]KAI7185592.1 hypothetical protein KC324_g7377 [Hortaea werneckii]KAI7579985.1 hypothetical protein KC316_g9203 [Hortaea werneckii]KAI7660122.1 hypothetical protein KC318_g10282 [Hortaea werneckii]